MHATPSRQRYRIEQTHVGVGALPAYARRSVCRNEQYARRFGYTHTLTRNSLLKPNEYAASWNKVARLLQLRDAGVTDTLVSFDIDVQVLDHTRSLAELLAPCGDAGLVLTTDANLVSPRHQLGCCRYSCKCMINAGFAVLRGSTAWLTEMLRASLSPDGICRRQPRNGTKLNFHRLRQWETDCFQRLLSDAGLLPSQDALRRQHSLLHSLEQPALLGPGGRVCVLSQLRVAPPLPSPNATRAVYAASEERDTFRRFTEAALAQSEHPLGRPFAVHNLQLGCRGGRCSRELASRQLDALRFADSSDDPEEARYRECAARGDG